MARALQLAERGFYSTHPNPRVGCVIARDDQVIAEGWHEIAGGPHAEAMALTAAGDAARGATVYVTLEPCSHHGRTPPCSDALVHAGVARVVYAAADSNRKVDGAAALADAGIEVAGGLLAAAARRQNEGFFSRQERQRPFVRLKVAASLDGATAMDDGSSQWISGEASRADVQKHRAAASAVLTGIGTVLADDPSLNVRDESLETRGRQPARIVIDSRLRMPANSRMLRLAGDTLVYCVNDAERAALEQAGADVVRVTATGGRPDLNAVLTDLASREVNDVLVEAGATLGGAFLQAGLVDELILYQAPVLLGSRTRGLFTTPDWRELSDKLALKVVDLRQFGEDTRIIARPDAASAAD
jgi:diaminohydroxyphosphoribosylaminopyrimidine deaminase/5-amino-6-(5-phosphoribosylamino)uracil reductase